MILAHDLDLITEQQYIQYREDAEEITNKLNDGNIKNLESGNFKLDKGDYIIRVSEIK